MKIEDYSFGHIVIDSREYTSDALIFPDGRIDSSWWRDEGHVLKTKDIIDLISAEPELILAGTGASGAMRPEPGLARIAHTFSAFNEESDRRKVAACLHLTC